jgi:hypothetical protein
MNTTFSTSFTRLTRVLAAISIVPALFLPFYQAFLHGGRLAVDINPRVAAYMGVHILGAYCVLFATCGVIAIYLRYHARMGRIAPLSLILSFLAQTSYAGTLFIDGFFNPLLAHYDPVIQTQSHSGDFSGAVAHSALLQSFGIVIYIPILMSLIYIVGNMLLGSIVLLKRFLPWPIGILFLAGGLILGIALMVPPWVEVMGYAAEGLAIAWSAFLIWRDSKPVALVESVA